LIENQEKMAWATIMLQKEVADRLTARPGTKQYGVPTVLLSACATVTRLLTLKPAEFHPRPKIDSVVVRIDFDQQAEQIKSLPPYDHGLLHRVVRGAFSQRRKTLVNTLSAAHILPSSGEEERGTIKQHTEAVIRQAELSPSARAEDLSLEDFIRLTLAFADHFSQDCMVIPA
jgi:16S rRNA (adenine1518-N6/adenine1519-N6)-dimethyltransferase